MAAYLKEIKGDTLGKSYSVCTDKDYFLIGRKKENDLVVGVSEVSRFNCFIAVHPQDRNLYLFSTSRNRNILYNPNVCDFSSKDSIVASSLDALLSMKTGVPVNEVETKKKKDDKLIDAESMMNLGFYRVGEFKKIRDILPVLDELQQVEYFEHCIKEGAVKLKNESFIGIRTSSIEIVYQLIIDQRYRTKYLQSTNVWENNVFGVVDFPVHSLFAIIKCSKKHRANRQIFKMQ